MPKCGVLARARKIGIGDESGIGHDKRIDNGQGLPGG
jgi:hypothetical protein